MNLNERFVITINRELGSGGRTVGRKLAERLGVPFYDKALINALQEKYHLTVDEIEKLKGRSHSWWAEFKRTLRIGTLQSETNYYQVKIGEEPDLLTTDEMFNTEKEILNGMVADESCIVAGRSGFYVFRNHPNRLSILIQASKDFRVQRVAQKQGLTPEEASKTIEKVDKMRENYVNKYTKTSRYDTRNYDLVISADGKTEDEIVDLILLYIGQK
ncbi:MAG: cytidylate kinase-like family protein [Prevotella sp.]|nr:cytidylate kinase-like family protein [Prevotella sp.]